ncbi:rhomboid family intramembrane serine protease [uncultured Roseobacter sp.]|uniref:rhomboid family intramembrane serine protease n=1 Tax=uncultured Roseobacter sp. TaxID=114847 RepID=UPI002615299E|nr:rhomboid family intramembrane serine protease [uncultured Roseobacter sp.]
MSEPVPDSGPRFRPEGAEWLPAVLIVLCVIAEGVLLLGDTGLVAATRLRTTIYEYGGFWPGLLRGWEPNYPWQPWTMFVTYGFLHGGLVHMVVNMITLWSLGGAVTARVGGRGFLAIYLAALLGGAGFYGLLSSSLQPMVGASGALFGLAGGLLAWAYIDRFSQRMGLWPVARMVGVLIALNVVMWWALDGQLAWETHLGGFVAGWIMASLIDPRPMPPDPEGSDPGE